MGSGGLPAVFVPLPTAAANHQEKNAVSLVSAGAAEMIREKDLNAETFERIVLDMLASDEKRALMAEASKGLGKKDAAAAIAEIILERYGSN